MVNDFNFEEWLFLIEDSFLKVKNDIKELYKNKFLLDKELSILFVEKVSTFYKEFYNLYDSYSLEAPEPIEYLKKLFSSDLEELIKSYSELLYFKTVIKDLTDVKVEIPKEINKVWIDIHIKYINDFIIGVEYQGNKIFE